MAEIRPEALSIRSEGVHFTLRLSQSTCVSFCLLAQWLGRAVSSPFSCQSKSSFRVSVCDQPGAAMIWFLSSLGNFQSFPRNHSSFEGKRQSLVSVLCFWGTQREVWLCNCCYLICTAPMHFAMSPGRCRHVTAPMYCMTGR